MADVVKDNRPGCLIEEATAQKICDHIDNGDIHFALAGTNPIADNNVDSALRQASVGSSTSAARADHVHPIRRQANPGDPSVTVGGTGITLNSVIILDRWSDEESFAYRVRALVSISAGTGWGYVNVPTKAGFQQPQITAVGTYRTNSTTPQRDNSGGTSGDGAAPIGPFMGAEAHHWSSTNRIYNGYYRRDNGYSMYIEFTVRYVRT